MQKSERSFLEFLVQDFVRHHGREILNAVAPGHELSTYHIRVHFVRYPPILDVYLPDEELRSDDSQPSRADSVGEGGGDEPEIDDQPELLAIDKDRQGQDIVRQSNACRDVVRVLTAANSGEGEGARLVVEYEIPFGHEEDSVFSTTFYTSAWECLEKVE